MTACAQLSDRMVAVLHGGQRWSAEDQGHLGTCADCAAEWRLVQATAALGRREPAPNSDRIAALVRHRLATEPAAPPQTRWRQAGRILLGLAVAAAIILAMRAGRITPADKAAEIPSVSLLSELDDLNSGELENVLETFAETKGSTGSGDGVGLGDLNESELEHLLRSWEG